MTGREKFMQLILVFNKERDHFLALLLETQEFDVTDFVRYLLLYEIVSLTLIASCSLHATWNLLFPV